MMEVFTRLKTWTIGLTLWHLTVVLWLLSPEEPTVFLLWLLSVVLLVGRLRFNQLTLGWWFEALLLILLSLWFQEAVWVFLPYAWLLWSYKPWVSVAGYGVFVFALIDQPLFILFLGFSVLLGLLFRVWTFQSRRYVTELDELRETRHQLEEERAAILHDQAEQSRLSVLSERDRIARQLHDDLGHDLTGALLALRAYESTRQSLESHSSFSALKARLENAVETLKDTVHQTKPEEELGFERFEALVCSFEELPITFESQGDQTLIPPAHWPLLMAVVKEALTNVRKHAQPKEVTVTLTPYNRHLRLVVQNDGVRSSSSNKGFGLNSMRRRVEAFGGTLSVDHGYQFTLVCVCPIQTKERG